jgi:DNA polymerase V
MLGSGITDQAVLVVDRSVKPAHNSIVVASIDGEFVCKRLKLKPKMCLMPDNPDYPPIFINHGQELEIVGTVTAAINKF